MIMGFFKRGLKIKSRIEELSVLKKELGIICLEHNCRSQILLKKALKELTTLKKYIWILNFNDKTFYFSTEHKAKAFVSNNLLKEKDFKLERHKVNNIIV